MNEFRKQRIFKLFFFLIPSQEQRVKFLKKHRVFAGVGENCMYQPRMLPTDPKCVKIHNNVKISTGVRFFCHDVIYDMLNHWEETDKYKQALKCIEIMDNVVICGGAIILPGVKIGPNAVVGAGSIVTKDVPEGTVVAGNPARVIGNIEDLKKKYEKIDGASRFSPQRIEQAWKEFEESHAED